MQGDQSVNITVSLKIMKKERQTFFSSHDLQEIWMTRLPVQNVTCENVQVKG